MAASFFPENYKQFPFKEGDLLASKDRDGMYSITKILQIDKVILEPGDTIIIQSQRFTAPVKDFLLIISASYGESEFSSLEQAKQAASTGKWTVRFTRIPNRPPGAAEGLQLIGHAAVTEEELEGYYLWKAAFKKGEAGVF